MPSLNSLVQTFGYWAVFLGVGLESLGIPVPGETILITASFYAGKTHMLNIGWILVAAIAGAILGDNAGYLIGHWGGYRLLRRYGHRIGINESRVKLARYLFIRYGGAVVFFGRFVSILRAYAAFLAGTTRMPWPKFLFFNAAGGIVWATWWTLAAYFFGSVIDAVSRRVAITLGIAAAIVVVASILLLRRYEARLIGEAERALPGPLDSW